MNVNMPKNAKIQMK